MVRTHPQWRCALDLVNKGKIGEIRSVLGFFSYFLRDPKMFVEFWTTEGADSWILVAIWFIHRGLFSEKSPRE